MATVTASGLPEATFTNGSGNSSSIQAFGTIMAHVRGTFTGSVSLERSNDGGSTFAPVIVFSAAGATWWFEPCRGVQYRFSNSVSTGTAYVSFDVGAE